MASIFSASFLLLMAVLSSSSSSVVTCFAEVSRKELRTKENELGKVIQLSRTSHSNRVDPSRVVQLSWRPRVFLYKGFLSDEECDQLISMTHKLNEKSSNDSNVGEWKLESSKKTRELEEDDIVSRIDERISAWTFLPQENGTALKVMRYGVEDSNRTLDYLGKRSSEEQERDDYYPIIATIVLYLSNVSRGGQILFPDSEKKDNLWSKCGNGGRRGILRPTRGNAILFFPRNHDTSEDYRSDHARCPILDPEKEMWWASKLFRVEIDLGRKRVPSDDFLCFDQNRSCPKWAHLGECERNPVFMTGSDDYFGTCRFSCKVC